MRNGLAIARRILSQFAHDKRTLALLFVAPLAVLWLLSVLLGADAYVPRLAMVDLPVSLQSALERQDALTTASDEGEAEAMLRAGETDAVLSMKSDGSLELWVEGSDSAKTAAAMGVVTLALSEARLGEGGQPSDESVVEPAYSRLPAVDPAETADVPPSNVEGSQSCSPVVQSVTTTYLHGSEDWKAFDFYGPLFIGIFVFAFVFLTSGMSLVNERSSGTMARFLATPVTPVQILGGYTAGFGLLALAQSSIILFVALTFIGFPNEGSLGLVMATVVSMALASVTLGLLVSGLAKSAFQVIQLMLLFVTPQILLSGLFDLSNTPGWLQALSQCFPVTYGADALRAVMLRGAGLSDVGADLAALWGFIALFFALAALRFRKKRA